MEQTPRHLPELWQAIWWTRRHLARRKRWNFAVGGARGEMSLRTVKHTAFEVRSGGALVDERPQTRADDVWAAMGAAAGPRAGGHDVAVGE